MSIYQEIKRFVAHRERAYAFGKFNARRRYAVSRLKMILSFIGEMTAEQQRGYLGNYKAELFLLLPSENSRFKKQREKILELINRL